MAGENLQQAATQQPSVMADEQTLSQFDDIPDDVIDGMSGGVADEDEAAGSDTTTQPGAQFSAHEDVTDDGKTTETVTDDEGKEQGGESKVTEGQETQTETTETESPVETEEQRAAREAEVAQRREAYVGELVKTYALSEEDAQKALMQPEEVLPKLAANLHANVVSEVIRHVQAAMPAWMQQATQVSSVEVKAREAFFTANPDLNKPEYEAAIISAGKMFRQMNPKAKPEVAIKAIGRLVRASMNLEEAPGGETTTTNAPAKPFRPARPGGSGTPPAPRRTQTKVVDGDNPDWGELAKDE
jgi:hypothetical protein